jgi:hypothetical protein
MFKWKISCKDATMGTAYSKKAVFANVSFSEMTQRRTKRGTFIVDYEGNRELVNCSFHPVLLR